MSGADISEVNKMVNNVKNWSLVKKRKICEIDSPLSTWSWTLAESRLEGLHV